MTDWRYGLLHNIVTKTGDQGTTGTLSGDRISKASNRLELNGNLDEVNASLGYLSSLLNKTAPFNSKAEVIGDIEWIQNGLFNLGTEVSSNFLTVRFLDIQVQRLESRIEELTKQMPPQTKFILYSGVEAATWTHVVRAQVRRAERSFVRLLETMQETKYPPSYQFVNRLSDYLFTLARFLNQELNGIELVTVIWD